MIGHRGQLRRFASVGAVNTALGLLVIFACKGFGNLGDTLSNSIGYGVGLFTGFWLNRQWTFQYAGRSLSAFIRYLVVLGLAYLANLFTVLQLVGAVGLDGYLAQGIGVAPYAVLNYLGCRYFVFPPSNLRP